MNFEILTGKYHATPVNEYENTAIAFLTFQSEIEAKLKNITNDPVNVDKSNKKDRLRSKIYNCRALYNEGNRFYFVADVD